jgi:Fe2+ transport system protein B
MGGKVLLKKYIFIFILGYFLEAFLEFEQISRYSLDDCSEFWVIKKRLDSYIADRYLGLITLILYMILLFTFLAILGGEFSILKSFSKSIRLNSSNSSELINFDWNFC